MAVGPAAAAAVEVGAEVAPAVAVAAAAAAAAVAVVAVAVVGQSAFAQAVLASTGLGMPADFEPFAATADYGAEPGSYYAGEIGYFAGRVRWPAVEPTAEVSAGPVELAFVVSAASISAAAGA